MQIISADEYDAAVALSPAFGPLAAAGDRRTGRELLADAAADAQLSVAAAAATPHGRALLDRLATLARSVRDRFRAAAAAADADADAARAAERWVERPLRAGPMVLEDRPGEAVAPPQLAEAGARRWWAGLLLRRFWNFGHRVGGRWPADR